MTDTYFFLGSDQNRLCNIVLRSTSINSEKKNEEGRWQVSLHVPYVRIGGEKFREKLSELIGAFIRNTLTYVWNRVLAISLDGWRIRQRGLH